jgi:hypothetical protein
MRTPWFVPQIMFILLTSSLGSGASEQVCALASVGKFSPLFSLGDLLGGGCQNAGPLTMDFFPRELRQQAAEMLTVWGCRRSPLEKRVSPHNRQSFPFAVRLSHEIKVMAHETMGVNLPAGFHASLAERLEEGAPGRRRREKWLRGDRRGS